MHVVHAPKKDDMCLVIPAPKHRLRSAPASMTHKDKRRKARATERSTFRKEYNRG